MLRDLGIATVFLTRLPIRLAGSVEPADLARASRYYPLVGAFVGLFIGLTGWLAAQALPPLLAATLACIAGVFATGAFHEDALGDVADGFGGGYDKSRKLEIMKDSRQGTYGVLAIGCAMLVRIQAIALLPPALMPIALIAVHALSRTGILWLLWGLPVARAEGLGADASRLSLREPIAATCFGLGIGLVALGPAALAPVLAVALGSAVVGWLSMQQVQGITGDVLGSGQQVSELLALLALVACHGAWGYALIPWSEALSALPAWLSSRP